MANQHTHGWTKDQIRIAKKVLSKHHSIDGALPEIQSALKKNVTTASVKDAFRRRGESATQHLAPEPLHPVEQQVQREKVARDKASFDDLVRQLREANERQKFIDEMSRSKVATQIPKREKDSLVREMTAVALGSDWHVEEQVDSEAIAGRNEYNLEIAERRIARFFNAIAWNVEHQRASKLVVVRDLVLWLGGDLMSGYIHEELLEGNALSPSETILWLLPKLRGGIASLLDRLNFESIVIPCSYGNHGRTTDKRRVATGPQNSFEWLMYNNLAREMESERRVKFEITKSAHQFVQAYDFTLHFHHGDEVKYQGGVGGLGIPLLKRVPMWDLIRKSDYHNIGHHHQQRDYGRANVNGSLIGYNAYAQGIGAEFEEPQQTFYMLDSKRGKCMSTPLWVGEREAEV